MLGRSWPVANVCRSKQQGIINVVSLLLADLKPCTKERDLQWGRGIHAKAVEGHNDSNICVATAIIKMYAQCTNMTEAHRVFDSIRNPDVVCWTTLLLGYADNGQGRHSLELLSRMTAQGCTPDSITYVGALKACTSLVGDGDPSGKKDCLRKGREIHSRIGCYMNHYVQSTLMEMYAKCGSMIEAHRVFDSVRDKDVVSWTVLILGYAECGESHIALNLFLRMKASGCIPNAITYVAVLKAWASLVVSSASNFLERIRKTHSEIQCHLDAFLQNTLIDLYAKCGSMADARSVFNSMQKPDVVSWNALMMGYADNGESVVALDLFRRMKSHGCVPDSVTYVASLKASASLGALAVGRKFHCEITEYTTRLTTCLIDFYAKCGSMLEARDVFDSHSGVRDVTTWTALLAGYGSLGDSETVLKLFKKMQDDGCRPDAVTFISLLLCCSHAGLVEKAREYIESMPVHYAVRPNVMHYTCMVDVLGRANRMKEAVALIQKMPCSPDAVTWRTLLGACCKWRNAEIGNKAFRALEDMGEQDACDYVLMSDLHRKVWEEQERVLETSKRRLLVDEMETMAAKPKGYVPEPFYSEALCCHSERRAVVFGMLKMSRGESVRVFKGTRMCEDCHCTTKMVSRFLERTVMVRVANRFHIMVNGSCSCGDYW